jgi:hypothetical protein
MVDSAKPQSPRSSVLSHQLCRSGFRSLTSGTARQETSGTGRWPVILSDDGSVPHRARSGACRGIDGSGGSLAKARQPLQSPAGIRADSTTVRNPPTHHCIPNSLPAAERLRTARPAEAGNWRSRSGARAAGHARTRYEPQSRAAPRALGAGRRVRRCLGCSRSRPRPPERLEAGAGR